MIFFSTNEIVKIAAPLRRPAVRLALISAAIFSTAVAWEFILMPLIFEDAMKDFITEKALKRRFIIEVSFYLTLGITILMLNRGHLLFSRDFVNIKNLNSVINLLNIPIVGIDLNGNITQWNKFTEQITGKTADEVMGRNLLENFIYRDKKELVDRLLTEAKNGRRIQNFEYAMKNKNGDLVTLLLNTSPLRDAKNNVVGVLIVGQDISELKQTQAQVIQASKLASLGEMATSVAHELNQPLNTIRMTASNIKDRVELGQISSEYLLGKLQRIEDQVDRASVIINHMRMFGRIADDKLVPTDLRLVIRSVLDLIGEQFRLENIELNTDCDLDFPFICTNQIQLEQVFINLLTNARDAILQNQENDKQEITIKVIAVANNQMAITISDTGGGIEESILSKIFEPFFTTKSLGRGTGLGLSISYGIIRDMNGMITAENINGGARFTITFPLADEPALTDLTYSSRAIADVM